MKRSVRSIAKEFIPPAWLNFIKNHLFDVFAVKSYSQEGEDMILRRYFEGKPTGFYVDIGAHHPKRFSNTYYFYKHGWRGINIDAMPGSMALFNLCRRRDINIECAVSRSSTDLIYYMFNEPALNGFSKELSIYRTNSTSDYRIIREIKMSTRPLCDLLFENMSEKQKIDFMNVDVEGMDLEVLESNNWEKYRPKVVIAEVFGNSIDELIEQPITLLMKHKGYRIFAKCYNSVFFEDSFA